MKTASISKRGCRAQSLQSWNDCRPFASSEHSGGTATDSPVQRRDGTPRGHSIGSIALGGSRRELPSHLKFGIERLSGLSMDDVRVHYGSSKPAQLKAHAYTQGRDIHLGKGQERHLPHEAWHVVQQRRGRVKPTMRFNGIGINDSRELEREADLMGGRAARLGLANPSKATTVSKPHPGGNLSSD